MRGCRDCRESVLAALEFDRAFLAPLAKDRPHLTHTEFVALRDSGFDTERQEPQTPAEWHLALCNQCGAKLLGLTVRPAARQHTLRFTFVLALVFVVGIGYWLLQGLGHSRSILTKDARPIPLARDTKPEPGVGVQQPPQNPIEAKNKRPEVSTIPDSKETSPPLYRGREEGKSGQHPRREGEIVEISPDRVKVALGRLDDVAVGAKLSVFTDERNESGSPVGSVSVSRIYDDFLYGTYSGSVPAKIGYLVRVSQAGGK